MVRWLVYGVLTVVLSGAALAYFFIPPSFSISVNEVSRSYLVTFVVCAAVMSGMTLTESAARMRFVLNLDSKAPRPKI